MLAEIKGKISRNGSNLSDRLEDKLTGDFFGALRYIPFKKAMSLVLQEVKIVNSFVDLAELLIMDKTDYWADKIEFWPYHEKGELDVLIELNNILIGIEVKLYSGLSSDDGIDNSVLEEELVKESYASEQQLAIESEILKEWSQFKEKSAILIFISPENNCTQIAKETDRRGILAPKVGFGYISWEEIFEVIKRLDDSKSFNDYERVIIKDLIALFRHKGLERFQRFEIPDHEWSDDIWVFGEFEDETSLTFNFDVNIDLGDGEYYEFK